MTQSAGFIDVKRLMHESSIEELNRLAEEYFAQVNDWSYHLAKPFGSIEEAPQLLINLAVVIQGLNLCRGMTVMDFGAGTCWASRFLTQLGCRVIAVDVSPTALRMGQKLYAEQPPFGNTPATEFLLFDGQRLNLADASVDRIMCLHALHHVPNPQTIVSEFGRVLKEGGIAGFGEPGPEHSLLPQSQDEMKKFGVIENDVDIKELWRDAEAAGFTDLKLAIFNVPPFFVSAKEFEEFARDSGITKKFSDATREFLKNQRTFFLYKGTPSELDSRFPGELSAVIKISTPEVFTEEGKEIRVNAVVTNDSPLVWLPRSAGVGAVHLGCHVFDQEGRALHNSYHWEALTPGDGVAIRPGETFPVSVTMPPLPAGNYLLEFDMVSNEVAWFSQNGSPTVRIKLQVLPMAN